MKLKKLSGRAVRGLREFELLLEGRSLLVWGENGAGKSSVVDALELLFTGGIRHLTGTQGISVDRHAHHQAFSSEDLQVDATFDPGAIEISRTIAALTRVPTTLAPTWNVATSGQFILRRSQLLDFIYADPGDRFRTIGSLIGIEALDQIELSMMRVRDQLDGEVAAKQQEVDRIRATLGRIAGQALAGPNHVLDVLNREARNLGLAEAVSMEGVPGARHDWLRSVRRADERAVHSLNSLVALCESARLPPELQSQSDDVEAMYMRLASQREALARISEVSLLREGRRMLELRPTETCPLCEQPIDSQATLAQIASRQETLQELSDESAQFRSACQRTAEMYASASGRLTEVISAISADLVVDQAHTDALRSASEEFERFAELVRRLASFEVELDATPPRSHVAELQSHLSAIRAAADGALSAQTETDHDRSVLQLITRALELEANALSHAQQRHELSRVTELHRRAAYLFDSFSEAKKTEVRRVYTAIEADVRRFYERLHPGEPFVDFQLVLQEGRRASTQLRIKAFGGGSLDPRALSSEGHLDSLGLCIFLAFARRFLAACPFLVLDDVVMSVDAGHRGRIADLLLDEFSDRQLIITTHDEIWFEEFVDHEEAYGANGRFLNDRIQSWSFDDGARFQSHRPRWDVIEGKLADSDKRGAANDGRQYAEWILQEIVVRTRAKIELRRRYTFGDFFEPARARLRELLPEKSTNIDGLFSEMTATGLPANFLSHANDLAPGVSIAEIRRFCDAVHALHIWFTCPTCHQFLLYNRDVSELRCVNRHCSTQLIWRTR